MPLAVVVVLVSPEFGHKTTPESERARSFRLFSLSISQSAALIPRRANITTPARREPRLASLVLVSFLVLVLLVLPLLANECSSFAQCAPCQYARLQPASAE